MSNRIVLFLSLALGVISPQIFASSARAIDADESKLKAAYIFNFAKFTRWPSSMLNEHEGKIVFCVLGDPRIQRALRTVESRSIGSHGIALVEDERVALAPRCHVLYLGEAATLAEGSILAFQESGALVISDAAFEGCIRFAKEGSRLSFTVDLEQARLAQITLSSDLLKIAKSVRGNRAERDP